MNKNLTTSPTSGLVVSEIFPPIVGGSGVWLWELFRRQPAGQYAMLVQDAPQCEEEDLLYPQPIIRANLSMENRAVFHMAGLLSYFSLTRKILKYARKNRAGIMFAARPLSEGLACYLASRVNRVPYCVFVHGEDINVATTSRELTLITRCVLNASTRIIANSNFTKSKLIKDWEITEEKIEMINPGVDCDIFCPQPAACQSKSQDNILRLFTAGRLQPRKGHDTVIEAIPDLLEHFSSVEYRIAGTGENEKHLRELAKTLDVGDRVQFLGEISQNQLIQNYQDCDIFVLANRQIGRDVEGFGIVLLEAQATGKPVIAGRSGGTVDTLIDGVTGYLMKPGDHSDLASIITTKLDSCHKRATIGIAARSHMMNKFSWEAVGSHAQQRLQAISR